MFIVDDPLLTLILRFVTDTDRSDTSNEEFLQRQIQTLKRYLAQFPEHQQGAKAMEWIGQHAENYRRDWQRRTLSRQSFYLRCEDCPMQRFGATEQCEIHEQWLYLLRLYTAGKLSSQGYIERSLAALGDSKELLRQRIPSNPEVAPQAKKPKKKKKKRNLGARR
jgi:hypothetical protein